jgi:D-mannonate dehydratase
VPKPNNKLSQVEEAIKAAVKQHIPLTRLSPYTRRWWTRELTSLKKRKEKLSRKSYKRRALDNDPIHEEFRQARNEYSLAIHDTKAEHWVEWLETLDKEGVWTAN